MGFIFDPSRRQEAQVRIQKIMTETKRELEKAVPFAMEPVVYDFSINENGTYADLLNGSKALMPAGYYTSAVPDLLRKKTSELTPYRRSELEQFGKAVRIDPTLGGMVQTLFDRLLPGEDASDRPAKAWLRYCMLMDLIRFNTSRFVLTCAAAVSGLPRTNFPPTARYRTLNLGMWLTWRARAQRRNVN